MSFFDAIILGLVQGITEFLPVSSSGHLILVANLLGVNSLPLLYTLVVHLGTLLAIIIALRKTIFATITKPFNSLNLHLLVSTLATGIIFVALKPLLGVLESGEYLVYCFTATAFLLLVTPHITKKRAKTEFNFVDAIVLGAVQGVAGLPGISRSGATICTGKILGADAKTSSEYSFLLSIPIIIISAGFEIISCSNALSVPLTYLLVGFVTAFISGLICVSLMLKLLAKFGLESFGFYLIILSVTLLVFTHII